MKPSLVAGVSKTRTIVVDRPRTIDFMGEDGRVYATPELVRDIEITCRELIKEHCEESEDSVGTRVELDHMAPTLMGMKVEITATVTEVKGRAVHFEVTAKDDLDAIGKGKHSRFVVDVAQTKQRLLAKAAKAKG